MLPRPPLFYHELARRRRRRKRTHSESSRKTDSSSMPLVPVMERLSRRTTQRLAHGSRPCLLRRRSRNRTKGRETRRDERLEGEFEGDVADEAEEDAAVGVREGQRVRRDLGDGRETAYRKRSEPLTTLSSGLIEKSSTGAIVVVVGGERKQEARAAACRAFRRRAADRLGCSKVGRLAPLPPVRQVLPVPRENGQLSSQPKSARKGRESLRFSLARR